MSSIGMYNNEYEKNVADAVKVLDGVTKDKSTRATQISQQCRLLGVECGDDAF